MRALWGPLSGCVLLSACALAEVVRPEPDRSVAIASLVIQLETSDGEPREALVELDGSDGHAVVQRACRTDDEGPTECVLSGWFVGAGDYQQRVRLRGADGVDVVASARFVGYGDEISLVVDGFAEDERSLSVHHVRAATAGVAIVEDTDWATGPPTRFLVNESAESIEIASCGRVGETVRVEDDGRWTRVYPPEAGGCGCTRVVLAPGAAELVGDLVDRRTLVPGRYLVVVSYRTASDVSLDARFVRAATHPFVVDDAPTDAP